MVRSWDVFCRVVDNFGDAAVCWRLARALARQSRVRLWIDQPAVLRQLVPQPEGVEILEWRDDSRFDDAADVAVDAFGAGLPAPYLELLAKKRRTLWIILEYLSAESWVAGHHGLPSPHPTLPIPRYFFFPGFVEGTGGLLREADFDARRNAFLTDAPAPGALQVSLFGYRNPALPSLLDAWASGATRVVAAVTHSPLAEDVAAFFGVAVPDAGTVIQRGELEARFLPFVSQERYDELLWTSDWNFVRGEDSFVRAQWAERPLVWQPYVQPESAHYAKLEAFLERYCAGLPAAGMHDLARAWNGIPGSNAAAAWRELLPYGDVLRRHAHDWAEQIARPGELAMNLTRFCSERIE
jgi:uncharacterized repeat protein (TIGR03837 family)